MKIGIGQINTKIGDFKKNREKILKYVKIAEQDKTDIIIFPELCLCGYPPMDLLDHDIFVQRNLESLRWLQKNCPADIAVVAGYIDKNRNSKGKPFINAVSVILNGKIIHTQAKTLLPSYDVFDETRYFEPAKERSLFEFRGERIGIAVCEDVWWESKTETGNFYSIDPVKALLDKGATLILVPSASPYHLGKAKERKTLLTGIGNSGIPAVYVNMAGGNDSLIFDGRSLVISKSGELIFAGEAFQEDYAVIDLKIEYKTVTLPDNKYKELKEALTLGLRDYLDKCGFKRVHLGLSGGIDSALTAVLAVEAVGYENVTAFALPSRYSSKSSYTDAKMLSKNLRIKFFELSIENIFSESLKTLNPYFAGKEPDITEENLQARIRGILLMAYSNKWDSLLLATGNKSELATGYCTLYGDMCGGLAVIGDLFKTEVFELCRYINSKKNIIPESIITKAPSAELRPDQKDEDSLPPYEMLDKILKDYLIENFTMKQIVEKGFPRETVVQVLKLVARAEYKRRQAPPVLKVSPRAFGTGRRIPIAREIYET